ncbi:DUF221-domain-containing protein [Hesseltinella vesiculosa]|uniref:DUF221-domain-containing protein n=1 Tax=Hesseltinella vesiculosa TaxID=101127 RepID=A0A1X2GJC8_9FUNG|nr:DUF221-domain-containing protein [Hesseltinella vesiculosa]
MSDSSSGINVNQQDDSDITLQGMATQLGINAAIAIVILMVFNILRPNNSTVYAPRYKYSNRTKKPPSIGPGLFSWFRVILQTSDDILLEKIGYDAVLFIGFIRMLRQLMLIMTIVGVCVLIPLNIIATRFSGVGTWAFSLLIYHHLWRYYHRYVAFRQEYFHSYDYQRSPHSRTLIIFNVPSAMQSDEALADWLSNMGLKYPIEQVCIGRNNHALAKAVEEHEKVVRKLEDVLSSYLKDGTGLQERPRPQKRLGGWCCCGGRKVDAIDHYTKRMQQLTEDIQEMRSNIYNNKPTNYGWISFSQVAWAHATAQQLSSPSSPLFRLPTQLIKGAQPRVELAPQPKDILWSNLALNEHIRNGKRLIVTFVYYAFVFFWFIPSSFLSASSNVTDFIRLFPNADVFIRHNKGFVALLSAWFTPIIMAIFFLILPVIMRILSQQQGSLTETSLDRQVFAKLYTFFVVNNLLVFTIASTLMQMYSQIKQAVEGNETLSASDFFTSVGQNLAQVAKNLTDVSTYWLSYVTLRSVGVIINLAQLFVLISITFRKWFTNPSPRQLQEFTRPTQFDYPVFFNLLIFFFTVGLIYSVISPLVLPFTLVYFMLATVVFKYLLMYVFVTRTETGGQMWRILFNRLLVSVILFQVVMIGILKLKSANVPSFVCVPLPILTLLFKFYCLRRLDPHVYYIQPRSADGKNEEYDIDTKRVSYGPESALPQQDTAFPWTTASSTASRGPKIQRRYGDPAFFSELTVPMVHEKVRHLLPLIYGTDSRAQEKVVTSKLTRQKSVRHLSMLQMPDGHGLPFQSVNETELENDDCTEGLAGYYKFEDDDEHPGQPPTENHNHDQLTDLVVGGSATPLPAATLFAPNKRKSLLGRITPQRSTSMYNPVAHDPYSATRPLMMQDDSSQGHLPSSSAYSDQHDGHPMDRFDSVEMEHLPTTRH